MKFRWLLMGILVVAGAPFLTARHIIGGVMTYECLGNNRYEFTLKVYRDCNCTNCAELDGLAEIGIYRCATPQDCDGQSQAQPYGSISAPLLETEFVDEPDYPCLVPPNVCGEEGTYRFTLDLPASNSTYYISYQRCCRNITINNIVNPEGSGATFFCGVNTRSSSGM